MPHIILMIALKIGRHKGGEPRARVIEAHRWEVIRPPTAGLEEGSVAGM